MNECITLSVLRGPGAIPGHKKNIEKEVPWLITSAALYTQVWEDQRLAPRRKQWLRGEKCLQSQNDHESLMDKTWSTMDK